MEIRHTVHLDTGVILSNWIQALEACVEEISGDAVTKKAGKLQPGLVRRLELLIRLTERFAGIANSKSDSSGHEKAEEEYEWQRLLHERDQ